MNKKLTIGPIEEKLEEIIVEGQSCFNDCKRTIWSGDTTGILFDNCTKKVWIDAHWTVMF